MSGNGKYDPGWNDPPKLQYQTPVNSGKTKLNLNKRIAFPLQQGSAAAATSKPTAIVQPSPSSLPFATTTVISQQPPVAIVQPLMSQTPPPMRVPTIPIDSEERTGTNTADDISNQEDIRDYCINTFQIHLSRVEETSTVRIDEVQRRINLLSQMWLNNTLNISVHRKLLNIAKALESNNFNEAMENHRALVVDHSNVCTSWASALRQIILTLSNAITTRTTTSSNISSVTNFPPIPASTQTVVINPFNNNLVSVSPTIVTATTTTESSDNNSGIENHSSNDNPALYNIQHL